MTRRQEIIEELAHEFIRVQNPAGSAAVNRREIKGHMSVMYDYDFVAEKYEGIMDYSRPHLEGAVLRRVKELLEEREEKRPVLVDVVTGEKKVGPKGMSHDNFFESLYV